MCAFAVTLGLQNTDVGTEEIIQTTLFLPASRMGAFFWFSRSGFVFLASSIFELTSAICMALAACCARRAKTCSSHGTCKILQNAGAGIFNLHTGAHWLLFAEIAVYVKGFETRISEWRDQNFRSYGALRASLNWNALIFFFTLTVRCSSSSPCKKKGCSSSCSIIHITHTLTHTHQACITHRNFKLTCCRTIMAQMIKKTVSVFFCNLTPSLNLIYIIHGYKMGARIVLGITFFVFFDPLFCPFFLQIAIFWSWEMPFQWEFEPLIFLDICNIFVLKLFMLDGILRLGAI